MDHTTSISRRFFYYFDCFNVILSFLRHGIQEVSGSIPLISTIEALKTIGFQGFLLFCGSF